MLSKLRHHACGAAHAQLVTGAPVDWQALAGALGRPVTQIRSVAGGTLGLAFLVEIDGRPMFAKTHSVAAGQDALRKEVELLSLLGSGDLQVRGVETQEAAGPRSWLLMKRLSHCEAEQTPQDILRLTGGWQHVFERSRPACVPAADDFELLVEEGARALSHLEEEGKFEARTAAQAKALLEQLRRESRSLPRRVCHGDLGPRNIMADGARAVAVDWEDAFWGIEGYDYLYWLTFMANRKHIGDAAFGHTALQRPTEVAVLVLIVLLKSELSLRNGTHHGNRVSFEQRLAEIVCHA